MSNSLRGNDPKLPFSPKEITTDNPDTVTRRPNRFESKTSSIPQTQLVRYDVARVYRNSALSVVTGDIISWDTKSFDTTGVWNGATTLSIPTTGKTTGPWTIKAQVVWPGTGAGTNRQIEIRRNGTVLTTKSGLATTTYQDISDVIFDPNRNDLFTITVVQDSGGALALTVGSDKTFFSIVHTG